LAVIWSQPHKEQEARLRTQIDSLLGRYLQRNCLEPFDR
jgi:hypothetical protein